MKNKSRICLYSLFIVGVFLMLSGCSKKDDKAPITPNTVTDIDGNVYHAVTIGTQVWLIENLKVSKYRNGNSIQNVIEAASWDTLTIGAWSYYLNDPQYNNPYGKLYNGFAVIDSRGICPEGWHIPDDQEWTTLGTYVGTDTAGGALKEAGTSHWLSPNTGATNSTGFTALPGGYRSSGGDFPFDGIENLGSLALWWSSTEFDVDRLWIRTLNKYSSHLDSQDGYKKAGLSCRCIMD